MIFKRKKILESPGQAGSPWHLRKLKLLLNVRVAQKIAEERVLRKSLKFYWISAKYILTSHIHIHILTSII